MQIRTIVASTLILDIACEISGPETGSPVFLLHGWPDSTRTWDGLLAPLHEAGFRTIVPSLRGFGDTRFRRAETLRSGQLAALGQDLLDGLDALGIERCAVIGHDWGARAAYIGACLAPERFSHCIALSVGWGTNDADQILTLQQAQNYWYHWLMALPRGEALMRQDRRAFTRYIWTIWSPDRPLSDTAFEEAASAFDNPDWADIVLHSYRVRWGYAPGDPAYDAIEARLKADPTISVPTLVVHGKADPCNAPATSEGKERFFTGTYQRECLTGVGHFPQREAPTETIGKILSFLGQNIEEPPATGG